MGGNYACGLAITSKKIFWGNYFDGGIGRSALNGSGANQSFIADAPGNCGLGVGP